MKKLYGVKNLFVGRSTFAGRGVLAKSKIKKGELIAVVRGPVRYMHVTNKRQAQFGAVWIGRTKYTWIDPKPPFNRLNHSCDPSAGIRGRVRCYALRDIPEGGEITVDYATIEPQKLWSMKCRCGSPKCRKTIRSIHFLPYTTYKKYLPNIPRYFQTMYMKNRMGKST